MACLTGARCGFERKVQLNIDSTTVLGSHTQLVLIQDAQETTKQYTPTNSEDAYIDALTKLYNRVVFIKRLEQVIQNDTPVVMLYLDIDNFKNINNPLGRIDLLWLTFVRDNSVLIAPRGK